MIKINPQLEQHKTAAGMLVGRGQELFPALYRDGTRVKDIAIFWDEAHENVIVQTDVAAEQLIKVYVTNFLDAEEKKARRDLLDAQIRLAAIEEMKGQNRQPANKS